MFWCASSLGQKTNTGHLFRGKVPVLLTSVLPKPKGVPEKWQQKSSYHNILITKVVSKRTADTAKFTC